MKKLVKIKLINWHLFYNETIEINDNSLVSGENGSGKSTLLDAIQYLLVGGRGGVKFNVAATDDAKRTLEGYVRGRIGAVNKEYIREGDVITHVCLEFFDEKSKEKTVVGVVVDLPVGSTMKERMYILENVSIHDEMFLDSSNYPRDFKSMKEYFRAKNIELEAFESQKKYKEALSKFFGIDAKKYSQLLPKALAFRSINLQDFVFNFLLDDNPIDIQSLKNDVAQLKRIEAQIKSDREKLEKLDKISELGNIIVENKEQLNINEIIDNLNYVEQQEVFLSNQENELNRIDIEINSLKEEKEKLNKNLQENDQMILNLEKAKDNSDLARTISDCKTSLDKKIADLKYFEEIRNEVIQDLENEVLYIEKLSKYIPANKAFENFVSYYKANKGNFNIEELKNNLILVSQLTRSYQAAYTVERQNVEKLKEEYSQSISKSKGAIEKLVRNTKTYPFYVDELVNSINYELSRRYNKEINFRPFADLIEVNDETWRNALEGYLGGQRFDIIGDPKYFDEALEIYDKVKFEKKIYGVGLVNTGKLTSFDTTKEGTLAAKLDSEYKYARLYANMLLNNVYCVMEANELKNYSRSITPTCMTYGNFTARQINPKAYEIPFIGQKANEAQLDIAKTEYGSLEKELKNLYEQTDRNEECLHLLSRLNSDRILNQNKLSSFGLIKELRREIAQLEDQYEKLSQDPNFEKIQEQLEQEKRRKQQLNIENESLVSKIANLRADKERYIDHVSDVKVKIDKYLEDQKNLTLRNPEILNIAKTQYYALKQKNNTDYNKVTDYLAKSNTSLYNQVQRQEIEIVNTMRQYVVSYSFNSEPNIDSLFKFEQEANIIRNNNLIKYEQQAVDLRHSTEISFKEEFVNKLRASIQNAQQQIEELNFALDGKTFGTDTYQLVYQPSEDPEFKRYFKIIMENDTTDNQTLFTSSLSKRNEDILMELFEKISSDNPEYDKLAFEFLDYRNYMSYDIQIKNINGNISLFSKVSREKSGGETQVPFYIVIAASFQQLLSHNKRIDSGCVVLFDEAFNNMDESRIEAMMRFYNSLSIQLIISVPPQRVSNIISYINTSLIVVKHNDRAYIQAFKDERDIL